MEVEEVEWVEVSTLEPFYFVTSFHFIRKSEMYAIRLVDSCNHSICEIMINFWNYSNTALSITLSCFGYFGLQRNEWMNENRIFISLNPVSQEWASLFDTAAGWAFSDATYHEHWECEKKRPAKLSSHSAISVLIKGITVLIVIQWKERTCQHVVEWD